jgi:hypothetical protein
VHLAITAHWLTGHTGILTLAQIITGNIGIHLQRRAGQEAALRSFIDEQGIEAFPAVLVAPDLAFGIEALAQCYGIGAFRPNVVVLGWSSDPERTETFCNTLRTVASLERSMVLVRTPPEEQQDPWNPPPGPVDVWWRGKDNGHLMLLLAHLLVQNRSWRGRKIRLLRIIPSEAGVVEARKHLAGLIRDARIEATPEVLVADDFLETIHEKSGSAAVTFLGFMPPDGDDDPAFIARMEQLMDGLGSTIIVWSAGGMHLEA